MKNSLPRVNLTNENNVGAVVRTGMTIHLLSDKEERLSTVDRHWRIGIRRLLRRIDMKVTKIEPLEDAPGGWEEPNYN